MGLSSQNVIWLDNEPSKRVTVSQRTVMQII